jgi:hypothetical protein
MGAMMVGMLTVIALGIYNMGLGTIIDRNLQTGRIEFDV